MKPCSPAYALSNCIPGLAAVAALCLWGTLETYAFEPAYQQQNRDPYVIGAQFDRLASVAALVPDNAILGYLTDPQQGSVTESAMLIGAQYVLAPRVVSPEPRGTDSKPAREFSRFLDLQVHFRPG